MVSCRFSHQPIHWCRWFGEKLGNWIGNDKECHGLFWVSAKDIHIFHGQIGSLDDLSNCNGNLDLWRVLGSKLWTANVCWRVYIPVAQRGRFWCCVLNCAGHVFCSVSTRMGNLSQVPLDTILVHGFLDVSSMKSVNLFRLLFFGNEMGLFRKVFFEKIPLNHLKSWTSMVFQWFPFNKTISLKPPGGGADPMSESLRQGS